MNNDTSRNLELKLNLTTINISLYTGTKLSSSLTLFFCENVNDDTSIRNVNDPSSITVVYPELIFEIHDGN